MGPTDYSHYTGQYFILCICSRAPHCRTVLQNYTTKRNYKIVIRNSTPKLYYETVLQNESQKASPKKQSILARTYSRYQIFDLWEAALETERICFSKVLLESICHSQYIKVIKLFQNCYQKLLMGWLGMHC